jgi:hypothetical protein
MDLAVVLAGEQMSCDIGRGQCGTGCVVLRSIAFGSMAIAVTAHIMVITGPTTAAAIITATSSRGPTVARAAGMATGCSSAATTPAKPGGPTGHSSATVAFMIMAASSASGGKTGRGRGTPVRVTRNPARPPLLFHSSTTGGRGLAKRATE